MKFVIVFVFVFLIDVVWTKSVQLVAKNKRLEASCFSSILTGMGYFTVFIIINDPWTILVAIVAAFLGTFVSLKGDP